MNKELAAELREERREELEQERHDLNEELRHELNEERREELADFINAGDAPTAEPQFIGEDEQDDPDAVEREARKHS